MASKERLVSGVSAGCFLVVAIAIALVAPDERSASPLLVCALVAGYALTLRVRFEFSGYYATPELLAFMPLVLLAPLPYVPLLVALAGALSTLPDMSSGRWSRDQWLAPFADAWSLLGGVLVLIFLAPGPATFDHGAIYLLALAAHFASDFGWTLIRNQLLDRLPLKEVARGFGGTGRVDIILAPAGYVIAVAAVDQPLCLIAVPPLVLLMHLFSQDRVERYSKTLELHRAYRGTVQLLADIVEYDDPYTAHHSRSIVDIAQAVAEQVGMPEPERQDLEFAGLLHDVGKITIPKEILNKPSALTDEEYELIKTHTIEGQFILDRVGGKLGEVGEIVRACHERWDGAGYPDGLAGEEIPLAARIVFACDAYSAMTQDRVYRKGMPPEDALKELAANAGTQFDPDIAFALIKVIEEREPALAAVERLRPLQLASFAQRVRTGAA
jgi:hypothetical protein